MQRPNQRLAAAAILFGVYFAAGKLALTLAFLNPSATAVWPNSGIALAALLIFGSEMWPVILLGAFFVNLTTTGHWDTSICIAAGNTIEAVTGAWLVNRFAAGRNALFRTPDIFKFTILAGVLSTMLSATVGVTTLTIGGLSEWKDFWPVWLTWWLGDAGGDVIVAPVFLLWASKRGNPWKWTQVRFEAVILLVSAILAGRIVFNGILLPGPGNYPIEYLCMPFLAWAAFRFGQREAAVTTMIFAGNAISGTLAGLGPFGGESRNESLLLLQAFLGVAAVLTLVLSSEIAERRHAETEAMHLAVSDPLTGIGNHRRLMDALDAEIRRSERTQRTFAFLMLDLDALKKINDAHGHLVGNRALVRLAEVLKVHCRGSDIPVRFGGDEFAMVLPETNRTAAHHVAERVMTELAGSVEHPRLSVSAGISVWPDDGSTMEALLKAADRDLYDMKRRGHPSPSLTDG